MSRVLISTLYEKKDSTLLSIRNFIIDKVFLLVDKDVKSKQLQSIKTIKNSFPLDIKDRKIDLYDINSIANEVIKIIDKEIQQNDEIYVDVSQGRKPQALGLLFACYTRNKRIKKIVYWAENNKMFELPKLSLELDNDTKNVLKNIENNNNIAKLSQKLKIDRSKVHRIINRLLENNMLIKENDKYKITDAGKIVIL